MSNLIAATQHSTPAYQDYQEDECNNVLFVRVSDASQRKLLSIAKYLQGEAAALGASLELNKISKITICRIDPPLALKRSFTLSSTELKQTLHLDSIYIKQNYCYVRCTLSGLLNNILTNKILDIKESAFFNLSCIYLPLGFLSQPLEAARQRVFLDKLKSSNDMIYFNSTDLRLVLANERFVMCRTGLIHSWLRASAVYSFTTIIGDQHSQEELAGAQKRLMNKVEQAENHASVSEQLKSTMQDTENDEIEILKHIRDGKEINEFTPKHKRDLTKDFPQLPNSLPHLAPILKRIPVSSIKSKTRADFDSSNLLVDLRPTDSDEEEYFDVAQDEESESVEDLSTPVSRLRNPPEPRFRTSRPQHVPRRRNVEYMNRKALDVTDLRQQSEEILTPKRGPVTSTPLPRSCIHQSVQIFEDTTEKIAKMKQNPENYTEDEFVTAIQDSFAALKTSLTRPGDSPDSKLDSAQTTGQSEYYTVDSPPNDDAW